MPRSCDHRIPVAPAGRLVIVAVLAGGVLLGAAAPARSQSCWKGVMPLDFPQPAAFPAEIAAIIEIPTGGAVKYELDKATGVPVVDRFVSMSVTYPVNYGFVARSLQEDGDPLDVLVYTRLPILTGSAIRVRPIGIMRMTDRGEQDDKILAVPVNAVDPTYEAVEAVSDLPTLERERLAAFFRVYKELPAGAQTVTVGDFADAAAAMAEIEAAVDRCQGGT